MSKRRKKTKTQQTIHPAPGPTPAPQTPPVSTQAVPVTTQETPAESAGPELQTQSPPIETREGDRRFWPEGEPQPDYYVKRKARRIPCPKCRRLLLDDLGQAVVCTSSGPDVAFLRCKACGHRWPMPVRFE